VSAPPEIPRDNDRPKASSLRPLRALLPFLAPYRGRMLIALLALLVAAAAMLALPQALKNVIDKGFTAENAAAIDRYFLWLLVAAAVFAAFASLRMYLVNWIGERVVADLRSAVYARVIRMDPAFFEVTKTGEVLSRLTTDTTLIQSLSGIGLSILLRSTVSFVGSLVLLLLTNLKLALIIFALIPTVLAPMLLFGRRVRRLSRDSQDRVADTSGLAGETLNAIQTVQAFTLEELQGRRYDDMVEQSFDTAVRRTRVRAWLVAAAIMTAFSAITLVLWLGARAVLHGTMTGGDLAKFLSYAIFMGTSVAALSEMWGELQRASGAMERTGTHRGTAGFAAVAQGAGQPRGAEPGAAGADQLRAPVVQLSLAAERARAQRFPARHRLRRDRGLRRALGRRQEHGVLAAAAVL
jgi:ATP-binding cassette subfamily B protein